jgi:phosphatidylglycerophosphatase A
MNSRPALAAIPTMKTDNIAVDVAGTAPGRPPLWAFLTATFFGIGTLGPGPGTWGSAAAVLIWAGLAAALPRAEQPLVLAGMAAIAIAIGIPAATRVARASGRKDPGLVVIDEVAGQWITLLFVPATWKTLLAAFILFRGFDIVKPPPVRQLEKLPEGIGIVVDDVAAGLYALLVMQLLLRFGLLSR